MIMLRRQIQCSGMPPSKTATATHLSGPRLFHKQRCEEVDEVAQHMELGHGNGDVRARGPLCGPDLARR
eukprot:11193163-Lingulodinium_polyedra.AAC.1